MTLHGFIDQFFETGCEGILWCFFEDGKGWPECLYELNDGDHLKVFGENGEILFEGIIDQDRETGWIPYNPKSRSKKPTGQQCALGYWVHWIQRGWSPDEWAKLFFHQYLRDTGDKPLRAELTKEAEQP